MKNEVSEMFRIQREKLGFTQLGVAKKLGLSSGQYISCVERGATMPQMRSLYRLAKALKLDEERVIKTYLKVYRAKILKAFN